MKKNSALTFFLSIILFIFTPPLLLFLLIYQEVVRILLKIKYGKQFWGLLGGCDKIWLIKGVCRCTVHTFGIINSEEDVQQFNESMRIIFRKLFTNPADPKLICITKKYMGHFFLLKDQYTEEYVNTINVGGDFDQSYLKNLLSSYSNKALPKNDTALWEIVLFDQPIKWSGRTGGKNQYVIVFRFNHSLSDGYALIRYVLKHFCADDCENDMFAKLPSLEKIRNNFCSNLYSVLLLPGAILDELVFRKIDANILHNKKLSGERHMTWAVEEEERLVPMVKVIKKKFPEVRFIDVVLTAISASFRDFFIKNSVSAPEFMTAVLPIMFNMDQIIALTNTFILLMLDFPIKSDGDLLKMLRKVGAETKKLRNSPTAKTNYWILSWITPLIPEIFLRHLKSKYSTVLISSLPGTKKKLSVDRRLIHDVVFHVPHRDSTGVGLGVMSYDNRFQIGINVDKNLISNGEEVQDIADGVLKYIEEIYRLVMETESQLRITQ